MHEYFIPLSRQIAKKLQKPNNEMKKKSHVKKFTYYHIVNIKRKKVLLLFSAFVDSVQTFSSYFNGAKSTENDITNIELKWGH